MNSQLVVDRYRPLRVLGEGGFGTVVLAWDTRMQRRVAIKRLPLPLDATGRPPRPHGLAEARTAAMLGHPAIVTVYDFDTDADEAFIVMEHVDGASLAEVIDEVDGPLTLDEAAYLVESVADALEYAHGNGVLHLDIKPDNVLIARDGRVKVGDFGIATLSSLAGHGAAFGGTPGYAPLEQLEGRDVSARSDEWSFAIVVYEALTGVNPLFERTLPDTAMRLELSEPPPASSYVPSLPRGVDEVLFAALGDRPSERYPTVRAFADALLGYLGDPQAGRASLARVVSDIAEEEPPPGERLSELGLWDRLRGTGGPVVVRSVAVIESAWLAWAGLTPFRLEATPLAAAVGLTALAGALAPSLGVVLGIGCVTAGLAGSGAPDAALALAAGATIWWWLFGRASASAAVLPLTAPALAAARLAPAQSLLCGFVLAPLPAAVSALLGGVLSLVASAATLHGAPYTAVSPSIATDPWRTALAASSLEALVTSPASYVALAGWPLSALIMSVACSRASRAGAFFGAIGGAASFTGCYLLAGQLSAALDAPGNEGWAAPELAWSTGASLILVVLVVLLGAPIRAEGDARPVDFDSDD